jgi:hypothetical protein
MNGLGLDTALKSVQNHLTGWFLLMRAGWMLGRHIG